MSLEKIIGTTLRVGVVLSATLVVLGLTLLYADRSPSHINSSSYGIHQVLVGLISGNPASIVFLGVIVLVATPTIRVLELVLNYAWEKDRLYVVLSAMVLTLMLFGILVLPIIK